MSTYRINNNRRFWLLVTVLVILIAAAAVGLLWDRPGAAAPTGQEGPESAPEGARARWEAKGLENYRYTLQVGCFCLTEITRPVVIEVREGTATSITYADDGTAAEATLFERYDSIDDLFAVINEAEAQDPARREVTYAEETGVPLSVDIDISEQMADEELYLTVSDFEALG